MHAFYHLGLGASTIFYWLQKPALTQCRKGQHRIRILEVGTMRLEWRGATTEANPLGIISGLAGGPFQPFIFSHCSSSLRLCLF